MGFFRRYIDFISVPSKVRKKDNGRVVFTDNSSTVVEFRLEDILKKHTSCFSEVSLRNTRFCFYCFEDKVSRVNLTVRVWVRHADCFTVVFKDQNMIDAFASRKIEILLLPDMKQVFDFGNFEFGES